MSGSHAVQPTSREALQRELAMFRTAEVCRLLSIGKTKFWRLVSEGKLRARKQGRYTYVTAADLRAYQSQLDDAPTFGVRAA